MQSLPPPPQFPVTSPTSTSDATSLDLRNRRTSTCRPAIVRPTPHIETPTSTADTSSTSTTPANTSPTTTGTADTSPTSTATIAEPPPLSTATAAIPSPLPTCHSFTTTNDRKVCNIIVFLFNVCIRIVFFLFMLNS
ncbi:hypothetical protein HanRHA438_Chr12g0550421 [Helianthus annuus]|nr:hypothetical protein HanIR_Chr12g0581121 [Helianthus annuus]KAJ0866321.1 hypothetical protein HanRHA438_Chr12g0550421 [Helianthus annuus]